MRLLHSRPARGSGLCFFDNVHGKLVRLGCWDCELQRRPRYIPRLMQPDFSKFLKACADEGLLEDRDSLLSQEPHL